MHVRRPAPRTTILITGFGPFPGCAANATMLLVPRLAALAPSAFPDVRVAGEILPTEWDAAPRRLDALIAQHDPDVALHFGVSPRARGFEIEARGRNVRADSEDATGCKPAAAAIETDGPELLATNLAAAEIVTRLRRRGIAAQLSWDAGTYVCNALLYHALRQARARPGRARNGFVHIPADLVDCPMRPGARRAGSPLSWDEALDGGLEIIATCLGRPRAPLSGAAFAGQLRRLPRPRGEA